MLKFKSEKGLTLIELLITISVLAVVSAIALPVINNVVTSSNSNALVQTQTEVNNFIAKYSKSGVVALQGQKLLGYVDTDGDNQIDDPAELVDTFTLDGKYSISATGTNPTAGASYSGGGITAASVTSSGSTGSNTAAPSPTPSPSNSPGGFTTTACTTTTTFITAPSGNIITYDSGIMGNNGNPVGVTSNCWSSTTDVFVTSGPQNARTYAFTTLSDAQVILSSDSTLTVNPDGSVRISHPSGYVTVFSRWANASPLEGGTMLPMLD